MKHLRGLLLFVAGFASGALTLVAVPVLAEGAGGRDGVLKEMQTIVEVWNRVSTDYVDPVSDARLAEGCLAGLVALDDRSSFISAKEFAEISSNRPQASIGIELRTQNQQAVVVAPLDGTPAARADIWPGDVVLSIDSVQITGKKLTDIVRMLRGSPGSKVTLTIFRPGSAAPVDKVLTREMVEHQSARAERLPGGVVYLRVSSLTNSTARHVQDSLKAAAGADKPTGIVLDLRQNPGGLLNGAVQVADQFLESGTILSIEGRIKEANRSYSATPGQIHSGAPMIVLIDSGTASGAEIVADALRTHGGARLLGTKTYGLGTIQTILPLQNDSAIKITTARWKTAGGKIIEGNGLVPDIRMDVPGARLPLDQDPVVKRALAELKVKFI
jgi:carboxyl-terminal processing protease